MVGEGQKNGHTLVTLKKGEKADGIRMCERPLLLTAIVHQSAAPGMRTEEMTEEKTEEGAEERTEEKTRERKEERTEEGTEGRCAYMLLTSSASSTCPCSPCGEEMVCRAKRRISVRSCARRTFSEDILLRRRPRIRQGIEG